MTQEEIANYVVLTILGGALVIGLLSMLVGRLVALYDWARDHMSSVPTRSVGNSGVQDRAIFQTETNSETAETPQRVAETRAENITLGETQALARLVAAGKLGLTDAVKIGADAKSGEKYQKRSKDIKAAVQKIEDKYPQRTPEQAQRREELGLSKS